MPSPSPLPEQPLIACLHEIVAIQGTEQDGHHVGCLQHAVLVLDEPVPVVREQVVDVSVGNTVVEALA